MARGGRGSTVCASAGRGSSAAPVTTWPQPSGTKRLTIASISEAASTSGGNAAAGFFALFHRLRFYGLDSAWIE